MPELVAIDLPGGRGFVDALAAVWDTGDAAAPLDPRLPRAAAEALVAALAPTRLVRSDGEIVRLEGGAPVDDGDALVLATSGSTGTPRGVVLTHAAVAASAHATSDRLGVDPGAHHWLACLPLSHVGGLSVVTRSLVTGTPCTVLPGFDAEVVSAIARRGAATHVSLVATALGRIEPDLFACILLGGAAPPGGRLPPHVVTTYGMTETGSGVVYDGLPLDGVEVAIGTGLDGEGDEGEILLRAPMLLRAYRDGTDPRIAGPDGLGGWLPTGDGGRVAADGRLEVDGRLAEVVTTGGEKVWPVPVEQVLATHPLVAEAAVWRRPDPQWGERVVAWVVPSDLASPPTLDELGALVRSVLPPWAAPKELVVLDRLPRTASGKVRRRDLV
ncbi:MAG: class I adenylate-forming enzyme family protein [Acidimicrobiales bacterium]